VQDLLFLAHRIPYPPDKGDKIRSWNILQHLARRYRVHLGCFIDETRDWQFEKNLREICAECCFLELDKESATLRSLTGLWHGLPLTLPYYRDRRMRFWVHQIQRRQPIAVAFAYCSAMAQYLDRIGRPTRRVVDFVDLDSQKWLEYAHRASLLKRPILNREARLLAAVERRVASEFDAVLLSTSTEARQFCHMAPSLRQRVYTVPNGVDGEYFSPDRHFDNPYQPGEIPIVFTGAMDYWPNVDAVTHFFRTIFPTVRERIPNAVFVIVGSNPHTEVLALADPRHVRVTGRVDDVRPFTAHASVIIAPLRIARGIQNKVLEGMAMAKPVVVSPEAMSGIEAEVGTELLVAGTPQAFADAVCEAASKGDGQQIGRRARGRVLAGYTWSASLRRLDDALTGEATASDR
jgi:sugar transferase (PEP-CTERM/EpsH1 system associated)